MAVTLERETDEQTQSSERALTFAFGAWSFLASLLIFWVELMVAKMLLPRFGGSASVWNTALVFFQLTLLAGYAGAHLIARVASTLHKGIQLGIVALPLAVLPITLPSFLADRTFPPLLAVLLSLTVMVGGPFFALSTSTPTLQLWFSRSSHPRARDPYFLYSLSNLGSVVGLLGYPILIERTLSIRAQTVVWSLGYGCFVVLTIVASRMVPTWSRAPRRVAERPELRRRLTWAAIAFVPSLALLGVTRHLSTDVAAFPLMWTIPLVLYLASFVVTFRKSGRRVAEVSATALRLLVLPAALVAVIPTGALWLEVLLPLALLLTVSIAAHGRAYRDRPAAASLTEFYLWISIGGAAGGLFASLIAPIAFDSVIEYPLAVVLAVLFVGSRLRSEAPSSRLTIGLIVGVSLLALIPTDLRVSFLLLVLAGVVAILWGQRAWLLPVVGVALLGFPVGNPADVIAAERTFFGVYRVHSTPEQRYLVSGTTSHGTQIFEDGKGTSDPTRYYHPSGPAGDVMQALPDRAHDVGIIGLGIGSLVGYADADDSYTFYEIDEAVEEFATNTDNFTLLAESDAEVGIVIGDGRLEVTERRMAHDLLIVDAFTSDSIPVHLLTLEAFQSYFESLTDGGALLLHITNRHLDLEPVVGRIARELDASARIRRYSPAPDDQWSAPSVWVIVERQRVLPLGPEWTAARSSGSLWTDDYSNILAVVDWN